MRLHKVARFLLCKCMTGFILKVTMKNYDWKFQGRNLDTLCAILLFLFHYTCER